MHTPQLLSLLLVSTSVLAVNLQYKTCGIGKGPGGTQQKILCVDKTPTSPSDTAQQIIIDIVKKYNVNLPFQTDGKAVTFDGHRAAWTVNPSTMDLDFSSGTCNVDLFTHKCCENIHTKEEFLGTLPATVKATIETTLTVAGIKLDWIGVACVDSATDS
ncbi:hypothetical protein EJ08DRAFT_693767 [Tothia fuscella]|uniref:Uncharacterized protein n=1 Tax=Tothia fuscella TaxID=1048955 RepID=A0A9P4U1V4_9PEZI|nr:hypothetical protein EJ08DRAFT_693767 [Tothia fuscella]